MLIQQKVLLPLYNISGIQLLQKSALNLLVARQQKLFEQQLPNVKVDWKEFPAGPQMLEALAVGAVDFGYVGNTPAYFLPKLQAKISAMSVMKWCTPNSQALGRSIRQTDSIVARFKRQTHCRAKRL